MGARAAALLPTDPIGLGGFALQRCKTDGLVRIGARTLVKSHVVMEGPLEIGEDNVFFPYSTVGVAPQDLKYHGERSATRIGNRNRIREFVTIHRGTQGGGMLTSIGDDNLLMVQVHVAHDVTIGNHTVLSHAGDTAGLPDAVLPEGFGSPAAVGRVLYTVWLYPFEITSILLLIAVVGAVVLAKRKFA